MFYSFVSFGRKRLIVSYIRHVYRSCRLLSLFSWTCFSEGKTLSLIFERREKINGFYFRLKGESKNN